MNKEEDIKLAYGKKKTSRWDNPELVKENELRSIPVSSEVLKDFNKLFDEKYRSNWEIVDKEGNVLFDNL